jgi:hypothetical protein
MTDALLVIPDRRQAASPESITTVGAELTPIVIRDSRLLASLGRGMTNRY